MPAKAFTCLGFSRPLSAAWAARQTGRAASRRRAPVSVSQTARRRRSLSTMAISTRPSFSRPRRLRDEFTKGTVHINGIEGFWGLAKVRLAKFKGLPQHTFHLHLKETEWRYNHRHTDKYQNPATIPSQKPTQLGMTQVFFERRERPLILPGVLRAPADAREGKRRQQIGDRPLAIGSVEVHLELMMAVPA